MEHKIEEYFDEIVPEAGDRAAEFLGVIRDRCTAAGIGIELRPHEERSALAAGLGRAAEVIGIEMRPQEGLRKPRLVLHGRLQVGKPMRKSRPMQLEVFADPIGNSLQVGWHVTKEVAGGIMTTFKSVAVAEGIKDRRDYSVGSQRQMSAILNAFHKTVFLPVLQELTDAVQRRGPAGSGGFLGAQ